ncbi:MAG: PKD domain-containing protein, partial [Thermoplasmata archaeon]
DDVGEGYGSSVPEPVLNSPTDYVYFEGEPIHFSARAIYSGDEASLTFQWDFGDGSASTGRELDHTYSDDGRYFVVLTVSDADGNADQLTVRIIVLNVDPAAQINSPYGGEVGDAIHMSAQANDPGDDILTFEWNFGDGQSAIGEKVTHVYLYPGLFSVTLTVHDGDGGKAIIKSIAVIREIIQLEPPIDDEVEPDETPETPEAEETPESGEETQQSETEEGTSSPTVVWRRPPSSYWDVVTLTTDHGDASLEIASERSATWSSSSFAILLILGQFIALLAGTFVWIRSRKLR